MHFFLHFQKTAFIVRGDFEWATILSNLRLSVSVFKKKFWKAITAWWQVSFKHFSPQLTDPLTKQMIVCSHVCSYTVHWLSFRYISLSLPQPTVSYLTFRNHPFIVTRDSFSSFVFVFATLYLQEINTEDSNVGTAEISYFIYTYIHIHTCK
jgi:hypothetical protein